MKDANYPFSFANVIPVPQLRSLNLNLFFWFLGVSEIAECLIWWNRVQVINEEISQGLNSLEEVAINSETVAVINGIAVFCGPSDIFQRSYHSTWALRDIMELGFSYHRQIAISGVDFYVRFVCVKYILSVLSLRRNVNLIVRGHVKL